MTLINSRLIYKALCKSNISYRAYIQKVCKELTGSLNDAMESLTFEKLTRSSTASSATRKLKKESVTAYPKRRRTCSNKLCKNRETNVCMVCQSPMGGKCCSKQCLSCP